ncbi:MAG: glycoside hydrolase family protein [Muribaculaceae bacterium]|nr:glycoside hydrolase family protein [Muribaculaceae bacterium]
MANTTSFVSNAALRTLCALFILIVASSCTLQAKGSKKTSPEFEKAIELLKKYEGLHKNHGNLIGYGHLVVKGDGYAPGANLSEAQAERLLRKDLLKLCKEFRHLGKDSLFMAVFAYNLGSGGATRSSVYKNLVAGKRNIKNSYLSYCTAKGKVITQLQKRRQEEYDTLFLD